MAQSTLVLYKGARLVAYDELQAVPAPPPQGRWFPVSHGRVLDTVTSTLTEAGYQVDNRKLALSQNGQQFFGTIDLASSLATGVTLAVGVRNSVNRTFPLGFCAGNRTFICDNLAFRSDLLVRKKHTVNGARNFSAAISLAVTALQSFREVEAERIRRLRHTELPDVLADSLILGAYEKGVINSHELPRVLHAWRQPSFEEFEPRTAWSLLSAFTSALSARATTHPAQFAQQTMRLNNLLDVQGI